MERLEDILLRDDVRPRLVRDVATLIDEEVEHRRGMSGAALRGGYRLLGRLRRRPVAATLDDMLDTFVRELDALWLEHGSPIGFGDYLASQRHRVAQGVLRVTSDRRRRSRNRSLGRAYDSLEPLARPNVERAVPRLARMIQTYVDEALGLRGAQTAA